MTNEGRAADVAAGADRGCSRLGFLFVAPVDDIGVWVHLLARVRPVDGIHSVGHRLKSQFGEAYGRNQSVVAPDAPLPCQLVLTTATRLKSGCMGGKPSRAI